VQLQFKRSAISAPESKKVLTISVGLLCPFTLTPFIRKPSPTREYWVDEAYDGFWMRYKMYSSRGAFHGCVVDLELTSRGDEFEDLQSRYAKQAEMIGATVESTGKSVVFRKQVPLISPPDFDEEVVAVALSAWSTLVSWWRNISEAK